MHATRVLAFSLMTACYSTPQPDCGFACGPAGACPDGYQCASDNRCHRDGTPASLVCSVDAPPPPPPRDAPDLDQMIFDAPSDVGPDADVTAPTVTSTIPVNGATGVSRTTTITVMFSEAVFNVSTTSFAVAINANPVAGSISAQSSSSYVFTPSGMLMNNATVNVSLSSAITDFVGNSLVPVGFSFSTGN